MHWRFILETFQLDNKNKEPTIHESGDWSIKQQTNLVYNYANISVIFFQIRGEWFCCESRKACVKANLLLKNGIRWKSPFQIEIIFIYRLFRFTKFILRVLTIWINIILKRLWYRNIFSIKKLMNFHIYMTFDFCNK